MKDEEPGPLSQPLALGHNRPLLLLHLGTRDQLFLEIPIGRIQNAGLALVLRLALDLVQAYGLNFRSGQQKN